MSQLIDECYEWYAPRGRRAGGVTALQIARDFAWGKKSMLYPEIQRLAWYIENDDRFDSFMAPESYEIFTEEQANDEEI